MKTNTFLAFALLLLMLLACDSSPQSQNNSNTSSASNTNQNKSATSEPLPVEIKINALDLLKAYEENEVSADEKFRNKRLAVTGKIENISVVMEQMYITLQGRSMTFVNVQAFFPDSQKESVSKLKKGQTITIEGTCDGKGLNVELKDCRIQ